MVTYGHATVERVRNGRGHKRWYTPNEVTLALGVSKPKVRKLLASGELASVSTDAAGRYRRVWDYELRRWLAARAKASGMG